MIKRSTGTLAALGLLLMGPLAGAGVAGEDEVVVVGEGKLLDQWLDRARHHGFTGAVAVERGGTLLLQRGYGMADPRQGIRVEPDTLFSLGSLSKQFTAAAVLHLEQQGLLDVHDPIGEHVDEVPEDKRAITFHHLLTHTAGFGYRASAEAVAARRPEDYLRAVLAQPLIAPVGEGYRYSNPGYSLLAALVERIAQQTFTRYCCEHLFQPAGLRHTGFYDDASMPEGSIARSRFDQEDSGSPAEWTATPDARGAGSVVSCVGDLLRWCRALESGEVLEPDRVQRMWSLQVERRPGVGYGYGWMLATTPRGTRVAYHAGDFMGYNAELRLYLDEGTSIAFLSPCRIGGLGLREAVMNPLSLLLNGQEVAMPPAAAESPSPERWVGDWDDDDGRGLCIESTGAALELRSTDAAVLRALDSAAAPRGESPWDSSLAELFQRISDGTRPALGPLMHPGRVISSPDQLLDAVVGDRVPGDGSWPPRFELLGHMRQGVPGGGFSLIRLSFPEHPEELLRVTWMGDRVLQFGVLSRPPSRRFVPTPDGGAACFDLFSGQAVILEQQDEGRLELRGPWGSFTGRRSD